MRKTAKVILIVSAALLLIVMPVYAITGTWVDDFEHPYVGMLVFYDADGQYIWRCSGTLISPTKVLTAGHCTDTAEGAVTARIYLQQDAGANYDPATQIDPISGYPEYCAAGTEGTLCATSHEIYNYGFANFAGWPNIRDVGLVILDQPIELSEYGQLPTAKELDILATKRGTRPTVFTVSGYGLSYKTNPNSPLGNLSFRVRLMAKSTLVNLRSHITDGYNLQTQGNGDSRGGTCSGDSGGPVFLGGFSSNKIVAVTSFGMNSLCRGTDFGYRIDQQEVLDWINSH